MRKLFVFLFSMMLLLGACTSDEYVGGNIIIKDDPTVQKEIPSTKVFVQGNYVTYGTRTMNRAGKYGDKWPKSMVEEGWESAKFSVRIDGTIPGYVNQDAALYWGGQEGPNLGKVDITYPFGRYDDRGLDYYLVDKKTGNNTGLFRYVLDPTGVEVEKVLLEKPDVWEILEYWQNKPEVKNKEKLDWVLANRQNLKVIWYVAKEVGGQYYWHVNGIITDKTTNDIIDEIIDELPDDVVPTDPRHYGDDVEVDIHLQEHKDWNEIKTSIHIRTDVESVTVNLPISYDNIVEADDFAIRIYDYYFSGYQIKDLITHDANGITIKISDIDPELINTLKQKFGDGLTIEVHSYCTKLEGVWEELKNSTVTTGKTCTLKYQITSAYKPDDTVTFLRP